VEIHENPQSEQSVSRLRWEFHLSGIFREILIDYNAVNKCNNIHKDPSLNGTH
jgi:hypothetical protein